MLLVVEAAAMLALLRWITPVREQAIALGLYLAALPVYTLQILLARTLPQWADNFSDSTRYDLNARALWRHWRGEAVSSADFMLKGLEHNGIAEWLPGGSQGYAEVFGMGRYFYQLYLAGIYALADGSRDTAVFANTIFLAGGAAGVFLLAQALFGLRRAALLAAALTILDTNFAVWGSVLLRDTLIVFLVVLGFLGCVRLIKREGRRGQALLICGGALSLLAVVRFNAVVALALAAVGAARPGLRTSRTGKAPLLLAGAALLCFALAVLTMPGARTAWENSLPGRLVEENLRILGSAALVVDAASGTGAAGHNAKVNDVRRQWHSDLREQPLGWLALRAAARTLMGPYPWVALTRGISGTNFYELMYPGMALWLGMLPCFLYALWKLPIRGDPAVALCLIWLALEAGFYIVGYGEFSGRERMMAQPLLWIFAARGFADLFPGWLPAAATMKMPALVLAVFPRRWRRFPKM